MSPLDLIRSRDGSMSLTKLAASTAHFSMAFFVAWLTWKNQRFDMDMWSLYAGIAILHATFDKTAAMVKDFKDKAKEQPQ